MADTARKLLSLLVSVLAQALLALVRCHLMPLMLLSVWHNNKVLKYCDTDNYFTSPMNTLAGLKAGIL